MIEAQRNRLPSAMELTETVEELRVLMRNVELLIARDRVRRYGGGAGALTQTDWSRLQSAADSLRGLSVGKRFSGGGASAGHFLGGGTT